MATPVQNFTAVLTALKDPTVVTNAQLVAVGDAYIQLASSAEIRAVIPAAPLLANGEVNKAALTQTDRANFVNALWLFEVRRAVLKARRETDEATAADLIEDGQEVAAGTI